MSNDLEARLRSLGERLDAERDAYRAAAAPNVVELRPRRRNRVLAAAAAVLLVLGGLFAIAFTRHPDGTGVTATDPPVTTAAAPANSMAIDVTYHFDDGSTDPQPVLQRLRERATALGLDATVTDVDPSDPKLSITVRNVDPAAVVAVQRAFLDVGSTVVFRPVTAACIVQDMSLTHSSDPSSTQVLPLLADPPGTGCEVGPTPFRTDIFRHDATVQSSAGEPAVVANLLAGADGEDLWNQLAAHCYDRDASCPIGQIAVEYGGWIYSAPTVQTPQFTGSVQIAGGFSDLEAKALAAALNDGPAPFTLTPG